MNLTGAKQPGPSRVHHYQFQLFFHAQIGRLFGPQEFALGFSPAIVISNALWRCAFGADPGVLGRTPLLDNDPATIIGVLPAGFRHPGATVSG